MPHTLLVADASATIRRVIELTFADEDIRVVSVGTGDDAVAQLDGKPPDLVLAAVSLSGKSGYDIGVHLKQFPRLAHIPLVLIAGAFEPIDHEQVTRAGGSGVFVKPFDPQALLRRVKALLSQGKQAAGPSMDAVPVPAEARAPEPVAPVAQPVASPVGAAATTSSLAQIDDYFDKLDAAFASLSRGAVREGAPARSSAATLDPAVAWLTKEARRSAESDAEAPATGDTTTAPALADIFARLLAIEQGQTEGAPATQAGRDDVPEDRAPGADAVADVVARRVLDQLPDHVGEASVGDIVAKVAERLVREEIARIKARTS